MQNPRYISQAPIIWLPLRECPCEDPNVLYSLQAWCEEGLAAPKRIPNFAIVTPNGFHRPHPEAVVQRLKRCEEELSKLATTTQ